MSADDERRDRAESPHDSPSDEPPNDSAELDRWDPERLAEAVGRAVLDDLESPVWRDARSAAWLADDDLRAVAREGRRASRRVDADASRVLALGDELRARAAARRLRLSRRAGRPVEINPLVRGTPGRVLEYALERNTTPSVDLAVAAGVGRELWDEPCDAWIEMPDDVPPGRYIALKVSGDSMAPLMHTGDTILVQIGVPLRRDSVIVARHPEDGYICKVVHRIRSATIELASLDPSRAPITIPRDDRLVIGTVVLVWCAHQGRR